MRDGPRWYQDLMERCPPRTHTIPDWDCDLTLKRYHEYATIADLMGFIPMPHQRLGWAIMAMPRCTEFVLVIGRQNGKTVLLGPPIAWRLINQPNYTVVYSAQTAELADDKVAEEFVPMFRRGQLDKSTGFKLNDQSNPGIEADNEARLITMSMKHDALRGVTRVGLGIIDEAREEHDYRRSQLLVPTTTVVDDAQIIAASTAGHLGSVYLLERLELARENANNPESGICVMEWGLDSDEDYDPLDEELWERLMPALGYTVSKAAVKRVYESMEPHDFAMEYLGRWLDAAIEEAVPLAIWNAVNIHEMEMSGELCMAVDTPPEQDQTVAVVADEHGHITLAGVRVGHDESTFEWLLGILRRNPDIESVAMTDAGPLLRTGERLEMEGFYVKWYNTRRMEKAAARFWEALHAKPRGLAILSNQVFNAANRGAYRKTSADGGRTGWTFRRHTREHFISPLIAATLALDGAAEPMEAEGAGGNEEDPWEDVVEPKQPVDDEEYDEDEEDFDDEWDNITAEARGDDAFFAS